MNDMRDTCVILEAPQNGLLCKSCWLKMMANLTVCHKIVYLDVDHDASTTILLVFVTRWCDNDRNPPIDNRPG